MRVERGLPGRIAAASVAAASVAAALATAAFAAAALAAAIAVHQGIAGRLVDELGGHAASAQHEALDRLGGLCAPHAVHDERRAGLVVQLVLEQFHTRLERLGSERQAVIALEPDERV